MADMVNDEHWGDEVHSARTPVALERIAASSALRIKVGKGYRFYRFDRERRAAVAEAMRYMSRNCDGAVELDGAGFNKFDASSEFVRGMVSASRSGAAPGHELTDRQAAWSLQCLWKYRVTQLESYADALWPEGMDEEE